MARRRIEVNATLKRIGPRSSIDCRSPRRRCVRSRRELEPPAAEERDDALCRRKGSESAGSRVWHLGRLRRRGRRTIEEALSLGYRHIDTAQMYGNEDQVGAAMRSSGIDRSELFITTKIDNGSHGREATRRSTEESLRRLATDYVDLLLIHWPSRSVPMAETLEAMAALRSEGKVRHLGVSNFTAALLAEAVERCQADLLCNQVEYHPFLPQRDVRAALGRYGMMLTAYSPLAKVAQRAIRRSPRSAANTERPRARSRCAG